MKAKMILNNVLLVTVSLLFLLPLNLCFTLKTYKQLNKKLHSSNIDANNQIIDQESRDEIDSNDMGERYLLLSSKIQYYTRLFYLFNLKIITNSFRAPSFEINRRRNFAIISHPDAGIYSTVLEFIINSLL